MPSGYSSIHPLTEQALRNLGVTSSQVTQGYGSAPASAGYHTAVGTADGRKFSHCVDLTAALISKDFMHKLWAAGFVAFARVQGRGWSGASHIHAIHLGLTADDGQPHLLSGPRAQIVDFLKQPPRSGLVGHALLTSYVPPAALQADLRRQYEGWLPDYPTRVLAPGQQQINCYAWLEAGQVTVDAYAFCKWWGMANSSAVSAVLKGLKPSDVTFDGRFWRAAVRPLAEGIGLNVVSYSFDKAKRWATVQIGY